MSLHSSEQVAVLSELFSACLKQHCAAIRVPPDFLKLAAHGMQHLHMGCRLSKKGGHNAVAKVRYLLYIHDI